MLSSSFDHLAPGRVGKLSLAFDLVAAVVATLFAIGAPQGAEVLPWAAVGCWVLSATVLRLYAPFTPRSTADEITLRGIAVASSAVVLWVVGKLTLPAGAHFSPEVFFGIALVAGTTMRLLVAAATDESAESMDDIVVMGTGVLGLTTYRRLTDGARRYHKRVVGFLQFEGEPSLPAGIDLPVVPAAQLTAFLAERYVDEVYIAARVLERGPDVQAAVDSCERFGVPFALPVHSIRLNRATLRSSSRATDGYLHYLSAHPKPVQAAVKRLVDIIASATALTLLSPLLITVAIAIKLTSKGPVLFKQERVGLYGSRFSMLKFRSMVVNAEELKAKLMAQNEQTGPVFKMKNDPRVTSIGRFIRKFSIDELPQLVNILRGDMTIVGPRPPVPSEVHRYKVWQRRRLSMRPGLTCFWQVQGRNNIGFEEWMRLDLLYIDHWSLIVDARLILATFPVVLGGRGAS